MKKNYIYALIAVFAWATLATVSKLLLSDIPNMEMLCLSSTLAALTLLVMSVKNGAIKQLHSFSGKDYAIMVGLGVLGLFAYSALYNYGLTQLSAQKACILNYLWPILLMLFSCVLLKERLTVIKGIAMLCSFFGVVILLSGNDGNQSGNAPLGIAACIMAAACYGLFSVLNKKTDYEQTVAMMIMWTTAAVVSGVAGLCTEQWVPVTGTKWLGFLWLGVVVDAVAYLLWALALRGERDTAKIANLAFLAPFLSLLISAVVLGEKIQMQAFIALIFIIGGILFQNLYEQKKRKEKP